MSDWLRRAGRGRLPDGRLLVWSVAEGRRGQRWRSSTFDAEGRVIQVLLIEVAAGGRFSRLEMSAPAGLLTLHPTSDGRLIEGNVVRATGVQPLSLPWAADHVLTVDGSPIPEILTRRPGPSHPRLATVPTMLGGLEITGDLQVHAMVVPAGEGSGPASDARGVPALGDSAEWALET